MNALRALPLSSLVLALLTTALPVRAEVTLQLDRIEHNNGIFFATNSAELHSRSFPVLQQIAALMRQQGSLRIEIQVHTDSRGSAQYNQRISHERARAVYEQLLQLGVAADRLTYYGFGEICPVASNRTAQGAGQNRRVVFLRLDSGQPRNCPIPPPLPPPPPPPDSSDQFPDPDDAARQLQ